VTTRRRRTSRGLWSLALTSVITAVGCVVESNDDPYQSASSGGSIAGSSFTASGGSMQAGADSSGGGTPGSLGESGSGQAGTPGGTAGAGGAEDEPGGAGGDAGSGGANACPTNGDDAACATCLKTSCCSAWLSCQGDAGCLACAECMDSEMDLAPCAGMGLCEFLAVEDPTGQMLTCGIEQCGPACGLDG
jgi:hypothetical protein